jgi:glycosyltransferase involved in cell wall biosynthesis
MKNKINIGVFIGSDLHDGGGYQYESMVLNIIKKYHCRHDINIDFFTLNKNVIRDYDNLNISINLLKENFFQKIHRISLLNLYIYQLLKKINLNYSSIEIGLQRKNIDLVYFLYPSNINRSFIDLPYIYTLWDLGHLELPELPEVSYDRKFEQREGTYIQSLKKAFRVTVDGDYSKRNVVKRYNLDEKRIKVLKFLPNIRVLNADSYIDIKKKYKITGDYIFYPAQFWAHKNHIYILKAIKILKEEENIKINAIFSGSDKGNLDYILKVSREYGIDSLVHYIGFAPDSEIPYLYKQSLSLVMPTLLGPTNIPPLEAFLYETPVCYSDTPFFREQVDGAVFFLDLNNPLSLVNNLISIINNKDEVEMKKNRGREILNSWNDKDFYNELLSIFSEYKDIREKWN